MNTENGKTSSSTIWLRLNLPERKASPCDVHFLPTKYCQVRFYATWISPKHIHSVNDVILSCKITVANLGSWYGLFIVHPTPEAWRYWTSGIFTAHKAFYFNLCTADSFVEILDIPFVLSAQRCQFLFASYFTAIKKWCNHITWFCWAAKLFCDSFVQKQF